MRDPARIAEVTDALRRAWERHPDLRLYQLLNSAMSLSRIDRDPFYVEEGEWLRALRFIENWPTQAAL